MLITNNILVPSEDTSATLYSAANEQDGFTYFVHDVQGNAAAIGLNGSSGANLIKGTVGHDLLVGSASNDELSGGAGDDQLAGGTGDDILSGGIGSDTLSGGEGQDIFILAPGEGPDTIVDFVEGVDSIQFAGGLTFRDVSMTRQGSSTFIRIAATNELLATLTGAPSLQIVDTPDVSFIGI